MVYRFSRFELDACRFELREDGRPVAVEPQVLSLLFMLAENAGRLVTRDEIIEHVWHGRIVSEAALSSRIKDARRALGDDGTRQELIKTVHGKGFRFDCDLQRLGASGPRSEPEATRDSLPATRPSIAVLPLKLVGDTGSYSFLAQAIAHEIIVELSRLRWLFVIARGSSFQLAGSADLEQVRDVLGARYCLTGILERVGDSVAITLELSDTQQGEFVWCERHEADARDVSQMRSEIVTSVVAALEIEIPHHEAELARLGAPEGLDAWSNYHLGLRHMYRFNKADNAEALRLFTRALEQQPHFARAHAALSFTHFQNAFLSYTPDVAAEAAEARRSAEQALLVDERDPFANVAMGRSFWLTGELDTSIQWLDRGIHLCPNYAQGIYARAWTETLIGDGRAGQRDADLAKSLSPIDPLRYAMLGTRGMSHMVRGEYAEAAHWADVAARDKGAHVMMSIIAAACASLAGDQERALFWARDVRSRPQPASQADFFRSFPFADVAIRHKVSKALSSVGI